MNWLLTPKQRQILQLAAGGADLREIALATGTSRKTLKNHFHLIYKRLWVNCKTQAVLKGIQLGEVDELQAYADLEARRRCAIGLKY